MNIKRLCVFCGAATGSEPIFKSHAIDLGERLVAAGIELVYGGGHVGLMGTIADTVLAAGGKVIGVIPEDLMTKELAHSGVTEMKVVNSMQERKAVMAELSDGFMAIPGGFGTLEEFCEMITGSMLGLHKKPCGILNSKGYYDHLLQFFDTAVKQKFLSTRHRNLILLSDTPADLLDQMLKFKHDIPARWVATAKSSEVKID